MENVKTINVDYWWVHAEFLDVLGIVAIEEMKVELEGVEPEVNEDSA